MWNPSYLLQRNYKRIISYPFQSNHFRIHNYRTEYHVSCIVDTYSLNNQDYNYNSQYKEQSQTIKEKVPIRWAWKVYFHFLHPVFLGKLWCYSVQEERLGHVTWDILLSWLKGRGNKRLFVTYLQISLRKTEEETTNIVNQKSQFLGRNSKQVGAHL